MVPLASIDDLKLERSPLSISPQPPGKFRWLGTQMIAFEPAGRMPFSTTYTAAIEAGETSTTGAKFGKRVQWQFSTPLLAIEQVSRTSPDDPRPRHHHRRRVQPGHPARAPRRRRSS
jgi:hypothetical protein